MKHFFELFNGGIETIALQECSENSTCYKAYKHGDKVITTITQCSDFVKDAGQLCCKRSIAAREDYEKYRNTVIDACHNTKDLPQDIADRLAFNLIRMMSGDRKIDILRCAFMACQLAHGEDIYTLVHREHDADIAVSIMKNPCDPFYLRQVIEHLLYVKRERGDDKTLWRRFV